MSDNNDMTPLSRADYNEARKKIAHLPDSHPEVHKLWQRRVATGEVKPPKAKKTPTYRGDPWR